MENKTSFGNVDVLGLVESGEPKIAGHHTREIKKPPEQLVDGDLILRRWRADDADALHVVVNSSLNELAPWMPWASNGFSKADAAEYLRIIIDGWDSSEEFEFAIINKSQIRGSSRMIRRIGPGGLEVGYWLATEATGRGLATRAAALMVRTAFNIGASHVQIRHDERNVRSGAVPRRLGFTCLGSKSPPMQQQLNQHAAHRNDLVWQLDGHAGIA